jgi:hypothetical protein
VLLLVLVLPSMTVNGAVLCSRCKTKKINIIFPTWLFPVFHPPSTEIDCKQEWLKIQTPGDLLPDEFECSEGKREEALGASFCSCSYTDVFCHAGKPTTAHLCDETLYVCWSLVPPQVLGLWDDTGNACTNTQRKIADLVYCDRDTLRLNEVDVCSNLCTAAASERMCPNGNPIDETIHITAPSSLGNGYWPRFQNSRGKAEGDIGFCDYGGESISDGWIVDPPIEYTCPDNIQFFEFSYAGECQAAVQYIEPECSAAYTMPQGYESGAVFNVGDYSFPVVFDDAKQTCDLTVSINVIDSEPPMINCPMNIQVAATGRECYSVVTYSTPVAEHNCGLDPQVSVIGYPSGSIFPAGISLIESVATGSSGAARCIFAVLVTTDPSVDCSNVPVLSCPSNMVVVVEAGKCEAVVEYSVTARHPSNGGFPEIKPVREKGDISGSKFPIGTTEMLFTASLGPDEGIVACQFTVTVQENQQNIVLGKKGKKICDTKKGKKPKREKKTKKDKKPKQEKRNLVRVRSH